MIDYTPLANRLKKNARHWGKWARRRGISCYRIYDRDIPEFPLAIDWYEGELHAQLFARSDEMVQEMEGLPGVLCETLELEPSHLSLKIRRQQKGLAQYEKTGEKGKLVTVLEDGLRFRVDLGSYLDTGLFLDHRQTRHMVRESAQGKRFLNLFAYTGSFTVYAAAGGASSSTTVDLSNTYLEWCRTNLELNGINTDKHRLVRADVFRFLEEAARRRALFDLIVMDPPSFSNSKKMEGILDVQRDHPKLIEGCLNILVPGGELIFSNNLRRFKLDEEIQQSANVEEITKLTVPDDFKRHRPHRCWRIQPK